MTQQSKAPLLVFWEFEGPVRLEEAPVEPGTRAQPLITFALRLKDVNRGGADVTTPQITFTLDALDWFVRQMGLIVAEAKGTGPGPGQYGDIGFTDPNPPTKQ